MGFSKSIVAAFFLACAAGASGADADFTVSVEPGIDPGAFYDDFHAAGAGIQSVFVSAFQIDITELNGTAVSFLNPFAAFCVEIQESISLSAYNYDFVSLSQVSRGRAGEAGTASSAIPIGGIGDLAASRVRALFDSHYTSSLLTDWTNTSGSPETHAFQLALWEITHDSDMDLTGTGGAIYVGAQVETGQANAVVLAQTWLDGLAGVTTTYTATVWDVWALEDVGNPGNQDILFATAIGSGDSGVIGAAVPEPTSALLLLVGVAAMAVRRRRE